MMAGFVLDLLGRWFSMSLQHVQSFPVRLGSQEFLCLERLNSHRSKYFLCVWPERTLGPVTGKAQLPVNLRVSASSLSTGWVRSGLGFATKCQRLVSTIPDEIVANDWFDCRNLFFARTSVALIRFIIYTSPCCYLKGDVDLWLNILSVGISWVVHQNVANRWLLAVSCDVLVSF